METLDLKSLLYPSALLFSKRVKKKSSIPTFSSKLSKLESTFLILRKFILKENQKKSLAILSRNSKLIGNASSYPPRFGYLPTLISIL